MRASDRSRVNHVVVYASLGFAVAPSHHSRCAQLQSVTVKPLRGIFIHITAVILFSPLFYYVPLSPPILGGIIIIPSSIPLILVRPLNNWAKSQSPGHGWTCYDRRQMMMRSIFELLRDRRVSRKMKTSIQISNSHPGARFTACLLLQ